MLCKNLIDLWDTFYSRYLYLSGIGFDVCDHPVLIKKCIFAAERFLYYADSLPKEEKKKTFDTLKAIRAFLKEHHDEIVQSREITAKDKLICRLLLNRNPFSFRLMYRSKAIQKKLSGIKDDAVYFP